MIDCISENIYGKMRSFYIRAEARRTFNIYNMHNHISLLQDYNT